MKSVSAASSPVCLKNWDRLHGVMKFLDFNFSWLCANYSAYLKVYKLPFHVKEKIATICLWICSMRKLFDTAAWKHHTASWSEATLTRYTWKNTSGTTYWIYVIFFNFNFYVCFGKDLSWEWEFSDYFPYVVFKHACVDYTSMGALFQS